jgi:hypothetical protein
VLKLNLAFKFGRKFSETETGWDFEKLTELPDGIEISPIFNISDLYPYKAEEAGTSDEQLEFQWKK